MTNSLIRTAVSCALLVGWVATATDARAENPYLTEALQAYDQFRFGESLRMLDDAITHSPTTKEEIARIRMYLGIIHYTLDDKKQAEVEFRRLLSLDPEARLPKGLSPKILLYFEELRSANPPPVPIGNADPLSTGTVSPPPPRGRIWTWVALGVGAAALAGGITSGVLAQEAEKDFKNAVWAERRAELKDLAESRSLAANVLYGTGGVVLAAAVVLFFVEADASRDQTPLSAGVTLSPAGFGLQAAFRF